MPTNTYTFTGEADNTDVGSVAGWERVWGTSGWATAMADGEVDFNTTDATGAGYAVDTGQTDHSIKMTYGSGKASGFFFPLAIRMVSAGNFIGARIESGNLQLYKFVSGSATQLGSNYATSTGDTTTLKIVCVGNDISVYQNDILRIGPITDSAHNTATKCGFVARSATAAGIITAVEVTYTSSALTITSVTPSNIDSGETVTIVGTGFGASQGLSIVKIGNDEQAIQTWGDQQIVFTASRGTQSMGNATLTVVKV